MDAVFISRRLKQCGLVRFVWGDSANQDTTTRRMMSTVKEKENDDRTSDRTGNKLLPNVPIVAQQSPTDVHFVADVCGNGEDSEE